MCCEGVRVYDVSVLARVFEYLGWFKMIHSENEVRGNKASERGECERGMYLYFVQSSFTFFFQSLFLLSLCFVNVL